MISLVANFQDFIITRKIIYKVLYNNFGGFCWRSVLEFFCTLACTMKANISSQISVSSLAPLLKGLPRSKIWKLTDNIEKLRKTYFNSQLLQKSSGDHFKFERNSIETLILQNVRQIVMQPVLHVNIEPNCNTFSNLDS